MVREFLRRCARLVNLPVLMLAALLPVSAALAGSASNSAAPAALPAAPTALPAAPSGPHYLLPSQVDIVALLPPPPAADSPAQRADLQAVLDAQRAARADGSVAHAVADAEPSCGRFSDVLGDVLAPKSNARLLAFLNQAARDGASISGPAKQYWKRTRPYAYSGEVEALADMSAGRKAAPGMDSDKAADALAHSSYPSGHATFGTVCAILLADMVPEKREALFARGRDYAHSRLIVGAHFPTDLEAGRIAGTVAAALLLQNASFRRDLAEARTTLRAALGLTAEVPDLAPDGAY
jgi:acid phosphatase (class A)